MRKTGYIGNSGSGGNGIDHQTKMLIEGGCEDVIVERFESLEGEAPVLDDYLAKVGNGDCLMTVDLASLSRNMVTCVKVTQTLKNKNAKFSTLDASFNLRQPDDELMLNILAAREELAEKSERETDS